MRWVPIALALLLLMGAIATSRITLAQFNGCPPGFCNKGAGAPSAPNCIEYQTGGCILYNTGPTNVILVN